MISSMDESSDSDWLGKYYNYLFYFIIIGVPVISAVFWTSFQDLGLTPGEPWLSFYVPASIFIAVMALLLTFAGWIYRMQRVTRVKTLEARLVPDIPALQPLETRRAEPAASAGDVSSAVPRNTPQLAENEAGLRLKVLVVDDDACNRMMLRKQLMGLGVESKSAQDGMAAVEAALHEHWDLILMDGQMPNMDGIEATREIRTQSRVNADTAIIAVTSNTCHGYRERCLASGMNGFCNKPLNADGLQELIESYIKPGREL